MTDTFDWAQLRAELSRDEGRRARPYADSLGIETVGIGHNLAAGPLPNQKYPMTDAQIDALFQSDIESTLGKLDKYLPWWRELDPVRQRVIINMAFNLGIGKPGGPHGLLSFTTFLGLVQSGQYDAAAKDMLKTLWARQVGQRANRLSVMMAGAGAAPVPYPPLPRPTPLPPKPAAAPRGILAAVRAIVETIIAFLKGLRK